MTFAGPRSSLSRKTSAILHPQFRCLFSLFQVAFDDRQEPGRLAPHHRTMIEGQRHRQHRPYHRHPAAGEHQFPDPALTMVQYQEAGQDSTVAAVVYPEIYQTGDAIWVAADE